jgi:hypothetical protein
LKRAKMAVRTPRDSADPQRSTVRASSQEAEPVSDPVEEFYTSHRTRERDTIEEFEADDLDVDEGYFKRGSDEDLMWR